MEQHGEYQVVTFNPYVTSRVGRNMYGEWDVTPVYKVFIGRGEIVPSNIVESEEVEFPSNLRKRNPVEFEDILDFIDF